MTLEQIVTVVSILSGAVAIFLNYRKSGQESESQRHRELIDVIEVLRKENERVKSENKDISSERDTWKDKYEKLVETIRELRLAETKR